MKHLAFTLLSAFALAASAADIHLAGDSTLAPRAPDSKVRSWGDTLRPRLADGCAIHNYAISGTSTVTFRDTWEKKLLGRIKEGDFVFIQFGHNDPWHTEKKHAKPGVPDRFCTPEQYEANIRKFIAEVKARKGVPVLLSPTPQRAFDEKTGAWTGPGDRHLAYFKRLPGIAASEKVDFLDMTVFAGEVVKAMGPEVSKELYAIKYGGNDNVHPSESGANLLAELFLCTVRARKLPVAACFK